MKCDLGYEHDEAVPAADPAPVVVDPGPNENDVKIAEIEAAAGIEREKMWTDQEGMRLAAQVDSLRGELKGMREVLDRVAPPAEPPAEPPTVPVVIPEPPAGPGEDVPAPEETKKKPPKSGGGYWDGYSA